MPVSRANHWRKEPAADIPASSSHPPSAARDATTPGGGSGRLGSRTGIDTLAVVPQLTNGAVSVAPVPRTSHAWSPAPTTTGVPGGTPRRCATVPRTRPTTASGGAAGGSRSASSPASSPITSPLASWSPAREAIVVSVATSPVRRHTTNRAV